MIYFEDLYHNMILEFRNHNGFNDGYNFDLVIIESIDEKGCLIQRINFGIDIRNLYYKESKQYIYKTIWDNDISYMWSQSRKLSKQFWNDFFGVEYEI